MQPSGFLRPRAWSVIVMTLAVAAFANCGTSNSDQTPIGLCSAPRSIAIEVDVTDSLSGRALADGASGHVRMGSQDDALSHVSGSTTLLIGGERLGVYDVTISAPGHVTWTASGIHVTRQGICGNVIPEHLSARLRTGP